MSDIKELLEHFKRMSSSEPVIGTHRTLRCEETIISTEDLVLLTQYIKQNPKNLGFERLVLALNPTILESKEYEQLIEAVNSSVLVAITYSFSENDLNDTNSAEIAEILTKGPTKSLHCDLRFMCNDKFFKDKKGHFTALKNRLIKNMQDYYLPKWLAKEDQTLNASSSVENEINELVLHFDPKVKQNPLKALISAKSEKEKQAFDFLLTKEVQFVEQKQETTDIIQEEDVTLDISVEQERIGTYSGPLVDFDLFQEKPYSSLISDPTLYPAFQKEWFGNLPHAVKFMTPEAATYIAKHAETFVALNVDFKHPERLPDGLFLQQTALGEWLIDYDPDREPTPYSVFTPKLRSYQQSFRLFFGIELPSEVEAQIRNQPELHNVWVKYGTTGLEIISRLLKQGDEHNPECSKQLKDRFLDRFSQWDMLFDDPKVITSLEEVTQYSPDKFSCLMNFLSKNNKTYVHLPDVVDGFELFWKEWTLLAEKERIPLNSIVDAWEQPDAGHPLVHMERLLHLLKNARSVKEQLDIDGYIFQLHSLNQEWFFEHAGTVYISDNPKRYLVKGMSQPEALPEHIDLTNVREKLKDKDFRIAILLHLAKQGHIKRDRISLNQYEAHYASVHEGFKLITSPMEIIYEPEVQNKIPFSKERTIYRTSLESVTRRQCAIELSWWYLTEEKVKDYQEKNAIYLFDKTAQKAMHTIRNNRNNQEQLKDFLEQYGPPHVIPYTGQAKQAGYEVYTRYVSEKGTLSFEKRKVLAHDPVYASFEHEEDISTEEVYSGAFRYAGQQAFGMDLRVLCSQLKFYKYAFFEDPSRSHAKALLSTLFLTTHTRSAGDYNFNSSQAFENIDRTLTHSEVNLALLKGMLDLYQQDIHMTEQEGVSLYERLALMNSFEFEILGLNKQVSIEELFAYFQSHRQATLLLLNYIQKYNKNSRWPLIYALDTAKYLEQDPIIAQNYYNDLLLFTYLLKDEYSELLSKDEKAELTAKLDKIKNYLKLAAESEKPNNFDYVYQGIIQNRCRLKYDSFIALYDALNQLDRFDPKEADLLCEKHLGQQFKAAAPQFFSDVALEIREPLLRLLTALKTRQAGSVVLQFTPPDTSSLEKELQHINDTLVDLLSAKEALNKEHESDEAEKKTQLESIDIQVKTLEQNKEQNQLKLNDLQEQANSWLQKYNELKQKDTPTLQEELNAAWNELGPVLSHTKSIVYPFVLQIAEASFKQVLSHLKPSVLRNKLEACFRQAVSWGEITDFKSLEFKLKDVSRLVRLYADFLQEQPGLEERSDFVALFDEILNEGYAYEQLYRLTQLLINLKQRDLVLILRAFNEISKKLPTKETKTRLMNLLERLNQSALANDSVCQVLKLCQSEADLTIIENSLSLFIKRYEQGDDPMVAQLLNDSLKLSASEFSVLLHYSENDAPRLAMANLLDDLPPAIRSTLIKAPANPKAQDILKILALCHSKTLKKERQDWLTNEQYSLLLKELNHLNQRKCTVLLEHLSASGANLSCLLATLSNGHAKKQSIQTIIQSLEKAPYGPRNDADHFDTSHVERVVNGFIDLNNNSKYPDHYRKQMMEAFLFINEAGYKLPMFYGKPAKELSNAEIKELFLAIKQGEPKECDAFKRRLLALGLVREAMYRATGQFPYSTQMIAIIDCMMHGGDLISNIDTGQGKSMIDMMKASILYLDSDRVDISTSSLVDAKRDLEEFSPFLSLLGIAHASAPVTSADEADNYQLNGVNISTLADYALYFAAHGTKPGRVSAVINESDFAILDDRVVYRYATTEGAFKLSERQEWVYDAVNHFVCHDSTFLANKTSKEQDAQLLRHHLYHVAQREGKRSEFIQGIPESVLMRWIDSGIFVNYRLQLDKDAVLSEGREKKKIRGLIQETDTIKIVQPGGKVSQNTEYGNGVQQLWFSKLAHEFKSKRFIKSLESHTIISMNNKNMIDYYRNQNGFIWGSSATVGADPEVTVQYQKYGFDFSKVEPHQAKQTQEYELVMTPNQEAQFEAIYQQLLKERTTEKECPPQLVFLKDIKTVKAFNQFIEAKKVNFAHQMYTGLGDEAAVIDKAAQPGLLTITTPALTRNTNIHYKKSMSVYITFVATPRIRTQMIGRTGRQGSEGSVYTFLNEEDLKGQSIEKIQTELLKQSTDLLEFHEGLYDVLGYFLRHLEHKEIDRRFYQEHWSYFSERLEERFREEKSKQTFDEQAFITQAVDEFNQLPHQNPLNATSMIEHLKKAYIKPELEDMNHRIIHKKDCIPADIIAYQYFKEGNDLVFDNPKELPLVTKAEVESKLKSLFDSADGPHFSQRNQDYLLYLSLNKASLNVIRETHTRFLNEFLADKIKLAQTEPWIKRWLGFQGPLTKVTNNFNYILLFKAMTDVSEEGLAFEQIKSSMIHLLEEYRGYHWFLNSQRKKAVSTLLEELNSIEDEQSLIALLMKFKTQELKNDNIENSRRWFVPINLFGTSRFQDTLDQAIQLASVCGKNHTQDINQLLNVVEEISATQESESSPKPYIEAQGALNKLHKHSMVFKVLKRSLDALTNCNSLFASVDKGMQGRRSQSFFDTHPVSGEQGPVPIPPRLT